jgi:NAD(P)H dehydrogenase (quinone)
MKALIVHAHPEPQSFNGALTNAAVETLRAEGHEVVVSDLYAERFNAAGGPDDFQERARPEYFHYQTEQQNAALKQNYVPELEREMKRLYAADLLILQFPLWWGGPPGVLKGWFDRVLAYGVAYVDGTRFDKGLFKGRRALLSVTTGGTPQRFREEDVYGPIEKVLWPVKHLVLDYMGYDLEPPFISYAAPRVTPEERAGYLTAWRKLVSETARKPVAPKALDPEALIASVGLSPWAKQR